jgi:hypothetical protein
MLSHAVMSVVQIFPSFVMLSLACVFVRDGLSSVEMCFDRGEDRCCGLSNGWNGGDGQCHHDMWCSNLLRTES